MNNQANSLGEFPVGGTRRFPPLTNPAEISFDEPMDTVGHAFDIEPWRPAVQITAIRSSLVPDVTVMGPVEYTMFPSPAVRQVGQIGT